MTGKLTYTILDLEELLPLMQLIEVNKISNIVRGEKSLYEGFDFNRALILITRRITELGRLRANLR